MSAAAIEPIDLIDYVVNQGNGVKGLSKLGLKSIPKQYIQPPEERLDKNQVIHEESIPIIDVSNWDDPRVVESISEAAGKWGFFQIINHGIPIEVLENVMEAAHKFFELPSEEKKKYLKENSPTQTVQLKTSFSLAEKVLEWKDFLMHFYFPNDESVQLWPSVSKDQVLEYVNCAKPVIRNLLEVLLKGLNVKELDKTKESVLMGNLIVDLMHYPKCPNPDLAAGVGRHSDISSITILLQDDVGGLYVRGTGPDQWIHVTPVKGALVVNIGDILQIVSNDRYKSIEHRVIVDERRDRVSVPIFVNPADDVLIGPFPEVLQNGEKPIYKQFLFPEYFNFFFSKGPEGKNTMEYVKL
ncbi:OLC1v1005109C1 [Oldenlandia corymbosa var. corymbosa]|uniref:feruloyl-CoA 6-hydroxylase n=1 Tax=Oldenlandia corymbosa var. corymbosa TaxID=529605 RepID=A0AAV1DGT5_OLDCO|nr:OLC1v1005109C1 [Oldenlandia corymbosa var. corymbosa]